MSEQHSYPKILAPGNWLWLNLALVVVLSLVARHLIFGVLVAVIALPWLCGLAVAGAMTPPRPLSETSALAKRAFWLLKAAWGALMVGVTAVYGAMVAIDLSAYKPADDEFMSTVKELALLPAWVAGLALWVCAMWITVDFWRCGDEGRKDAVNRILGFAGELLDGLLPIGSSTRSRARAWAADVLMACTRPSTAALTAYMATPILIAGAGALIAA